MNKNTYDRIAGALYGVAMGDALGAPLEFMSAEEIQQRHGYVTEMIGGGWLNVLPGEVTDDTQMTLCVGNGIIESPDDPVVAVGKRFIEWLRSGPKDVGGTCSSSISSAISFAGNRNAPTKADWRDASSRTDKMTGGRSAGNGSLMRTVYPGLYYKDLHKAVNVAAEISEMTHFDDKATNACRLYTTMIHMMVEQPDLHEREAIIRDLVKSDRNYACAIKPGFQPNPSGYVVDSFAAALHCILKTSSFEDAVAKAVNLGGDADTIGAITGGLAGALYGYNEIPEDWLFYVDQGTDYQLSTLVTEAVKQRDGD